jgi:3-oxoacyl-[acyl-carrier protein] reductase
VPSPPSEPVKPFGALREGDAVTVRHQVTRDEVDRFAALSGDINPLHLDDRFAARHGFRGRVAHGMLLGALLSGVLGTRLPGPGAVWLSQSVRFERAVHAGDEVEITVRVKHKGDALRTLVLDTTIVNQHGDRVFRGEARMMALEQAAAPPWGERVALVTGASRGIGAATVRALAGRGARVVVNYLENAGAAGDVVSSIGEAGGEAIAVQADVSTPDGARTLAAAAQDAYGRVDILVNSATPPIEGADLLETSWEDFDRFWRTYVQGAFTLAQGVVPGMRERGFGRIVHVLTTAIWGTPPPHQSGYVAAKSGLWGLAKSMALELAPHGITVNGVSPTAVMTEQWESMPETRRRARAMRVPAQRLADADEVAAAVLLLVGDDAGFVTGANLPVSGGEVM